MQTHLVSSLIATHHHSQVPDIIGTDEHQCIAVSTVPIRFLNPPGRVIDNMGQLFERQIVIPICGSRIVPGNSADELVWGIMTQMVDDMRHKPSACSSGASHGINGFKSERTRILKCLYARESSSRGEKVILICLQSASAPSSGSQCASCEGYSMYSRQTRISCRWLIVFVEPFRIPLDLCDHQLAPNKPRQDHWTGV